MESNQLHTEEVVSRWNASGHCKGDLALGVNHTFHSPSSVRAKSIFPDFEPFKAGGISLQSTVDFGEVCHDRAVVAFGNWVFTVAGV